MGGGVRARGYVSAGFGAHVWACAGVRGCETSCLHVACVWDKVCGARGLGTQPLALREHERTKDKSDKQRGDLSLGGDAREGAASRARRETGARARE